MSRRNAKRRMGQRHFAMVPVEVLTSDACKTLPNYSFRVLVAIAAQYRGRNNGDLAMTRAIAREYGIGSQEQLVTSLTELLARGLILKTRQGGKKPLGPTLYAVTWMPIDELRPKIQHAPTPAPSNAWAEWSSGPPADQSAKKHWVPRRTTSGPQADQTEPKSGLPADQTGPSIGSAEGPPSRSRGGDPVLSDAAGAVCAGDVAAPGLACARVGDPL